MGLSPTRGETPFVWHWLPTKYTFVSVTHGSRTPRAQPVAARAEWLRPGRMAVLGNSFTGGCRPGSWSPRSCSLGEVSRHDSPEALFANLSKKISLNPWRVVMGLIRDYALREFDGW